MEQRQYIIEQDWECDGALRLQNPKTIDHYQKLKYDASQVDVYKWNLFFAFSDQQFEEGKQKAHITDDMKIYRYGYGMFGTHEGYVKYMKYLAELDARIAKECDPQEVYVYEYNNHECMINWEGDDDAIAIIIDTWGPDVAKKIKRYSVQNSVDDLIRQREEDRKKRRESQS